MNIKLVAGGVIAAAAVVGGVLYFATPREGAPAVPVVSSMHGAEDAAPAKPADQIVVPQFSQIARSGEVAFNENCSACHGINAAGTDSGPPLVHNLYRPEHHPDESIMAAPFNGVRSHHWRYGDMPPVEGITEAKVRWIIVYLRELQVANGIK